VVSDSLSRTQRGVLAFTVLLLSSGYTAVGLVLILAARLWEAIQTRRVPWRQGPLDMLFVGFLAAFFISGLESVYRSVALGTLVLAALTIYLGYGPLYEQLSHDRRFLDTFCWAWVIGGIGAAAWALTMGRVGEKGVSLPALGHSSLATALLMAFFLAMRFFSAADRPRSIVTAAGLCLVLVAILRTGVRGAYVSLVVGLIVFLVSIGTSTMRRAAALLVALALVTVLASRWESPGFGTQLHRLVATDYRVRIALTETAVAIFKNRPLVGTGLGTFQRVYPGFKVDYNPDPAMHTSAHNVFLNMAAEGGILGLTTFTAIVLMALAFGLRWRRRAGSAQEAAASAAVLAAYVALMTHQLFESTILTVHLGTGFWFLIAIMAAFSAPGPALAEEPARTQAREPGGVLIVSNGHGEDAVGLGIANELQGQGRIVAFPLSGTGGAYHAVPLLDPRRSLPSGGFALRGSWRRLWADMSAGVAAHWLAQRATLRGQRGRHRLVVAIGDVYCLQMAALAGRPIVFIATAKSEYNEPHRWLERLIIRRRAAIVFTRDQSTADALRRAGLPAEYVGNPLMDTIGVSETPVAVDRAKLTVTILPGSRADAYDNLRPLLQVCEAVARRVPATFLCALAPGIDMGRVRADATRARWLADGDGLRRDAVVIKLTSAFGDAVQAADVVVGLAGTANEQAAGLGKAVVTFPGPGAQATRQFVKLQQRLLGDALVTTQTWEEAARAVVRLLTDPAERTARGTFGRQRMGSPGAIKKIAKKIVELLGDSQKRVT
jgi:uncharacterized protein (TIGR03492 family)